jgi:hypothetical protein
MALVTLRMLDGADRGQIFDDIPTPFTIGREEGNPVQLNDERVSRFHLKIQEDDGKLVLTDLESTNGTKVNGENVQLCIVRPGDIVTLGRSVILIGSQQEIAQRLSQLRAGDRSAAIPLDNEEMIEQEANFAQEVGFASDPETKAMLHSLLPPDLPSALQPGQAAQLGELLQYVQLRLRAVVQTMTKERGDRIVLDQPQWQNLLDLHERIAVYLRHIGDPEE